MTKARDLANIISGGFTDADIPNLPASKITSGTLDNARITLDAAEIPNISTDKLTTGTLANARVADLPTSKITSGTFADARISESSVTAHVSATDLSGVNADITALALREATNESSAAFNLPNKFIETFTDDTNLGTQTDGDRTSGYWSTIGLASTAWHDWSGIADSAFVTSGGTFNWSSGTKAGAIDSLNDGDATTAISSTKAFWITASYSYPILMTVDIGTSSQLDYIRYHLGDIGGSNANFHNVSVWTSPDNVTFTQQYIIMSEGATGSSALTQNQADTTDVHRLTLTTPLATRYIRFAVNSIQTSGNINPALYSLRFYMSASSVSATGTLIQTANTVASAKTKVGGTMLYKDNAGTATLGTDLKIYFSCNNGGAWTEAASYNAITPVYSTGIKQVRLGETTCTSGTGVIYKAVYANQASGSKETQLHGIGINY